MKIKFSLALPSKSFSKCCLGIDDVSLLIKLKKKNQTVQSNSI